MSQPYVGEIRLFPYPRGAPEGWQACDGSLLSIANYEVLYQLIGTVYGGDGQNTFAVPDMRGRIPIHQGTGRGLSSYSLGQLAGTEQVTLTSLQMPSHDHQLVASTVQGTSASPQGNVTAVQTTETFYGVGGDGSTPYPLPASTVGFSGGNQPHDNVGPTLALNYCIAWAGIYPAQS
ncbi:phage tail protein [Sphingomonas sp. M1-B02]|uniref:phage tail protein n=1 Tax=Sphingomonas sp. M1-B02 TaxID=3114300 RepID=UPI00223F3AA9|nr:tail fiber protein [Sphingomonas sp. S6-11]UZK66220.1 tail fiber protein [Sphingomonas sp. S6-11]